MNLMGDGVNSPSVGSRATKGQSMQHNQNDAELRSPISGLVYHGISEQSNRVVTDAISRNYQADTRDSAFKTNPRVL